MEPTTQQWNFSESTVAHSQVSPVFGPSPSFLFSTESTQPVCSLQHSWQFEGCTVTRTSELPISPTNWDHTPPHYDTDMVEEAERSAWASQMLDSWDSRIDEFMEEWQSVLSGELRVPAASMPSSSGSPAWW